MALVWFKSMFYPSLFPGGADSALYCGLKQLSGLSMAMPPGMLCVHGGGRAAIHDGHFAILAKINLLETNEAQIVHAL